MDYTDEQQRVIDSTGDIVVRAPAGSGKTSMLMGYADKYEDAYKLYLVYNASAKIEAKKKFKRNRIKNIDILTAHGLAYRGIGVPNNGYELRHHDYKAYEISNIMKIELKDDDDLALCAHGYRYFKEYCNDVYRKIEDYPYLQSIRNRETSFFVRENIEKIQEIAYAIWNKMHMKIIAITHDFYLKKYQLRNPKLNYDIILYDEVQDANPVMLDIFKEQDARKIAVGDDSQAIYRWRKAVNALDQIEGEQLDLTKSFRFDQIIANLSNGVLRMKNLFGLDSTLDMIGTGPTTKNGYKAILCRTNLKLLDEAIDLIFNRGKIIYLEGELRNYVWSLSGAHIKDVLALYCYKEAAQITNPLFHKLNTFEVVRNYAEKTEDHELLMITAIVEKYGWDLYDYLKDIEKYITNDKDGADIIMSTVHRAKGMEYDYVRLTDDFITPLRIKGYIKKYEDGEIDHLDIGYLNEEVNILYVAMTRAINELEVDSEDLQSYLSNYV
jgi:hypothetical protein